MNRAFSTLGSACNDVCSAATTNGDFVAPSPRQAVAEALDKVRGTPVLTVTDDGPDPASRGVIDFVLRDGHIRFRIDGRAAGGDGLAISSKLLSLAVKP